MSSDTSEFIDLEVRQGTGGTELAPLSSGPDPAVHPVAVRVLTIPIPIAISSISLTGPEHQGTQYHPVRIVRREPHQLLGQIPSADLVRC
jgi:hypothetical protein